MFHVALMKVQYMRVIGIEETSAVQNSNHAPVEKQIRAEIFTPPIEAILLLYSSLELVPY